MPRKTARTHQQGQESRRRILDATLEIAADRGYDGTTVALVTAATGLPASSVYWHFKNKDELLAEVLDHSHRQWHSRGPGWAEPPAPGARRAQLAGQLRRVRAAVRTQPEFWRLGLMLGLEKRAVEPAARARFVRMRGESVASIASWWRAVLPAGTGEDAVRLLARLTLAAVDGLFLARQADPTTELEPLLDVLAGGLDDAAEALADRPAAAHPGPAPAARGAGAGPGTPDDSRSRILLAAAQVAAERGYEGTTISRVCERSGLPVSSVYWFFKDKDELLAAVVRHSFEEWSGRQPRWDPVPAGGSWEQGLRAILTRSLRSLAETPDFMRIGHMLTLERRSVPPAGRALFLDIRREVRDSVAAWFAASLDPGAVSGDPRLPARLAQLLIVLSDGLFVSDQLDADLLDPDVFADYIVTVLRSGIRDVVTRPG